MMDKEDYTPVDLCHSLPFVQPFPFSPCMRNTDDTYRSVTRHIVTVLEGLKLSSVLGQKLHRSVAVEMEEM